MSLLQIRIDIKVFKRFRKIAPTIMLPSFDSDYKDNIEAFKTIAKAVGKEDKGKERLKEHDELMDKYSKEITMDKNNPCYLQ